MQPSGRTTRELLALAWPMTYARARAELPIAKAARELAAVGVPTGLQFGSEMLAMVMFTSVLGTLGAEQIAAHQIALAVIRLSFLPGGVAISEAVSVLVGQALGRRSVADADRVVAAALAVAVAFMATCGVIFAFAGQAIVAAFTEVAPVARVARTLLWIAAGFQVLDAVAIVLRGALRGAKDVRVPAMIGVAVRYLDLRAHGRPRLWQRPRMGRRRRLVRFRCGDNDRSLPVRPTLAPRRVARTIRPSRGGTANTRPCGMTPSRPTISALRLLTDVRRGNRCTIDRPHVS